MGSDKELFLQLGLSESKVEETLKNATLTGYLKKCVQVHLNLTGKEISDERKISILIYNLASKLKPSTEKFLQFIIQYIVDKKIDSELRLTLGLKYLLEHLKDETINLPKFENECGIGITVSVEEIECAVKEVVEKFKDELLTNRYKFNIGRIMVHIKTMPKMTWAEGSELKAEVELQVKLLLGPKTAEDICPVDLKMTKSMKSDCKAANSEKKKASPPEKKSKPQSGFNDANDKTQVVKNVDSFESTANILKKLAFHKPGENYTTEGYPQSQHAMYLLNQHVMRINGQVRTRFPPEPNGILHIGHAKAININFGYAKVNDGVCFLRYDDTNPEKEEERFFKSILEMVEWLGYKPYQVTHASDYFNELYEWALLLIKKGLAYVCHQKSDEIKGFNPPASPWRYRSSQESFYIFKDMKNGLYEEGAATLRMKITLEEGKQDPIAYRIRFVPHPRTGDKWCIYPTYDFTHCLCDSIEDITHSMCTKEFQNRRSSYYWLCESVDTYIPVQWEYGRLNMSYTVVSKRKIAKLIQEKIVNDWDDPRLFTLPALRRRGFPSEAINEFCVRMGITGAQITAEPAMLEACVRDVLNVTAPRTMVVMNSLKVVIENGERLPKVLSVPDFPTEETNPASHSISFESVIYIDRNDFKEKSDKGYKRFAQDQSVGLRHANVILVCKEIIRDKDGTILELKVTSHEIGSVNKPKGFIHWISKPVKVEIRLYEKLFHHKNPEDKAEVPGGFLSDCNRNSLFIEEGLADEHILASATKTFKQFQFERMGYFSIDPDSLPSKVVFNRTVTLKEDTGKK